ncbi:MAG: DUF3291 domain-containing protein [Tunicatimonas sp.]|uniref:DUF3291 domain-containing protein n=1 Tax=Tunicatimonas sp. TaxID=1940096 RepID=UPI003C792F85
MKVTVTSIKLKGPFKFFALSAQALKIARQLKATNCREYKKRGFWTTHYTMTLWNSEAELKQFAQSDAHLQAMKDSATIAREIRTYTYDADHLPDWPAAIQLLLYKAKITRF